MYCTLHHCKNSLIILIISPSIPHSPAMIPIIIIIRRRRRTRHSHASSRRGGIVLHRKMMPIRMCISWMNRRMNGIFSRRTALRVFFTAAVVVLGCSGGIEVFFGLLGRGWVGHGSIMFTSMNVGLLLLLSAVVIVICRVSIKSNGPIYNQQICPSTSVLRTKKWQTKI